MVARGVGWGIIEGGRDGKEEGCAIEDLRLREGDTARPEVLPCAAVEEPEERGWSGAVRYLEVRENWSLPW